MTRQIKIVSYFSIPTDLANEMRNWKEYISGEGYSVDLKNAETGEEVTVRYFEKENDFDFVIVNSNIASELFDRVVGRVICALSMHSDNLMVYRINSFKNDPF
jgi:hypothetical protein